MARPGSPMRVRPSAPAAAESIYADTLPAPDALFGVLLRAEKAGVRWSCGELPPLPKGCTLVDRHDLPSDTRIDVLRGCRVFAHEVTEYVGEPLMMLVGPEERVCRAWLERVQIRYRELTAPIPQEESAEWGFGQLSEAFSAAERELEAAFSLTLPRADPEPLTAEALRDQSGLLHLSVSTAEPLPVSQALRQVFSLRAGALRLRARRPLGRFSRRDEAVLLSCCATAAALKLGKCVRCELWEDPYSQTPSALLRCRWGIREGHISALELTESYSGASSPAELLAAVPLLYDIPAVRFVLHRRNGRALYAGVVPECAFPADAVELVFTRTAEALGRSEAELRLEQLAPGEAADSLRRMTQELLTLSGYKKKKRDFARRADGSLRGISLAFSVLADNAGGADSSPVSLTLRKNWRDSVAIAFDAAQPPSGAADSLCTFAAAALGLRCEQVSLEISSDTLPPVSEDEAERLLLRGCEELRTIWRDNKEQELRLSPGASVRQGWGIVITELTVDPATGSVSAPGLWCSCNTGRGAGVSETARLEGGLSLALPMAAYALTAPAHLRPQSSTREDALPERCSALLPAMGLAAACCGALEQCLRQRVDALPVSRPGLLNVPEQEGRL